jgi:succinyl-CoA synthetase alpha subunit
VPVYNTVHEAVEAQNANAAIAFVPARFAKDAILEGIEEGLEVVISIAEGIPVRDMMEVKRRLRDSDTVLIGPNSPGIVTVGEFISGFMPANAFIRGPVGVASRSGTLTYQTTYLLCRQGIGQTTCLGIGGDPIIGISFTEVLSRFQNDPETRLIMLIGEIGGVQEEEAAEYIAQHVTKPVVAYIAGRSAPEGKTMGHAGAIVQRGMGSYASKVSAFQRVGVPVAPTIMDIPGLVHKRLQETR